MLRKRGVIFVCGGEDHLSTDITSLRDKGGAIKRASTDITSLYLRPPSFRPKTHGEFSIPVYIRFYVFLRYNRKLLLFQIDD